ncbi:MAG: LamG-like jellyroll fold domain-containing protein [Verrucomicrobiota bacterium]
MLISPSITRYNSSHDSGSETDGDNLLDITEYQGGTDPTHADTDADSMDDYWEINSITPSAVSNALDNANSSLNPDGDYYANAMVTNLFVLTNGMVGTAFGTNVCWFGGSATNPSTAWNEVYTNTGADVFDLYRDTILKASVTLANRTAGTRYAFTNYFGISAGLTYRNGYPVWVDADNSGTYTTNDYAIVNPTIKHEAIYRMAPAVPGPGICSFDPRTAWTNITSVTNGIPQYAPNTEPYNNYQEYLGGDYIGRLSWDAGGQMTAQNDPDVPTHRNSYTLPNNQDTDADLMPDGWELYVGLNPNNVTDAAGDSDYDKLNNLGEWANATHPLGTCISTWPNKPWPTDPGVITAPSPNDPHPMDTDWDGLRDGPVTVIAYSEDYSQSEFGEQSFLSNPTHADTDLDGLPDWWEVYAGTSITNSDANMDTDFDGLMNWQEYWTGTVPEWMNCDPAWGMYFLARRYMDWNPSPLSPTQDMYTAEFPIFIPERRWFIPPNFKTCPAFLYANNALASIGITDRAAQLAWLRSTNGFPAARSQNYPWGITTLAGTNFQTCQQEGHFYAYDSDGDGMDDFWEVFHCLNPIRGLQDLNFKWWRWADSAPGLRVGSTDADPTTSGNQVGTSGNPFQNVMDLVSYYATWLQSTPPYSDDGSVTALIGPHNFGLSGMDPDNDGLVNLAEYQYNYGASGLHTCPSPLWRTSMYQSGSYSFVGNNYRADNSSHWGWPTIFTDITPGTMCLCRPSKPFRFANMTEGFDTDNDLISDYAEVTGSRTNGVIAATDPLYDESPLRNRVVWLDGTNSWLRSYGVWPAYGDFSKFSVEAWARPSRLNSAVDQVVCEKTAIHYVQNPDGSFTSYNLANFQLGISANGLPYVLFHDVTGLNTHRALASSIGGQLQVGKWAHLAGVFDGSYLTIYVNGEACATHYTINVPARGIEYYAPPPDYTFWGGNCYMSIGARGFSGSFFPGSVATNFFAGCIDEVRVWDRVLSVGEIRARKDRRLTPNEVGLVVAGNSNFRMGANNLFAYYRFTDLPDPQVEGIVPSGFPTNRPVPTINYSLVYTNYLVMARDIVKRIPAMPPLDTRIIDGTPVATSTNPPDSYGISTTNYLDIQLPADFRNSANPYTFMHPGYNWDMGGGMWLIGLAQGLRTNTWLGTLDPDNPDSTDSDGLPDWWEQLYGLDPNDATGVNGAWGDPDNDGLNNRAEYLAGTNPFNSDTDGDGIGDYDSPRGVYSRTYGEMYTDGDGMPDDWESENGLDPQKYDANLDLDGDGWSNYAEYQAGTDPNNKYDYPQPLVFGVANYYGNRTGMLRFYAYEINTMDGVPQITKVGTDSQVAEVVGQADGTFIFTGKLPIAPIDATTVVRISAPVSTNNMFVTFTFTGPETYTYAGEGSDYAANLNYVNGRFTIRWASVAVPTVGANVTVEYNYVNRNAAVFSLSGFKEGDFYLLALMDANGNASFDAGEPMGIMDNQPAYLSYSSISGIRALLTDTRPGFGRFAWTASTLTNAYPVVVNKISESGAPTILQRAVTAPRNYFHEWDFQLADIEGLMAGTYQWWMGSQNGTFAVNWPASLAKTVLVYPRGDVLFNALNQFAWTMDLNCPMAHFQVARGAVDGALVTDKYIRAPWMDEQNIFRGWLDDYASDWGNGVYYWRVAGWTPQSESAWSDWQTFHVNLSATNSRWVSGDIYYYGKAPATKIIVDAYDNRGFGGRPVARMTLTPSASTGWEKCSYTLRGLEQGAYYVRAFLDVTPAGDTGPNSNLDAWESVGFYRDPNSFYQAGLVDLSDAQFMGNARIVIRDRDTDNDKLPDAWEMAYFGNLDQTGDMDYDGDGETNLDEYIKDGVNQNPANWDTDGDGLADGFEPRYNGAAFGFARSAKAVRATLNPSAWDTDGDGYSDGAELLRYRTDPLDPTSYPRYRPLCADAWPSPGDYDGDGRSDVGIYDSSAGVWSFITMAGQSVALPFGFNGAQPMVGDYTGDNRSEFAFYDQGLWTIYTLSGQSATLKLGDASMLPAPADYTGDRCVDLAVFDTDSGIWYIYDVWSGALFSVPFGASGMIPVPGDYNGDGAADLVVYEPATGNWMLGCFHKYYRTWTTYGGTLGGPTWMPVPGDYDGDGRNDACLFESNTGRWMLYTLAGQFLQGTFGWKGCVPVPGDYDGDGRTDLAIYDTNTGMWYIICMSGAYYEGYFGWPGALPILKGR